MKRLRRPSSDEGLTLVELIVGMTLSIMLAGVLGAALLAGVRGAKATTDSYQNSADALSIATYLPQDIQSAAFASEVITRTESPNEAIGCTTTDTLDSAETHLLKLQWAGDTATRTLTYTATYRLAPEPTATSAGLARARLTRYFCQNGGAATVTVLARNLSAANVPQISEDANGVSVTFTDIVNGQTLQKFTSTGQFRLTLAGGSTNPVFNPACAATLTQADVSPSTATRTSLGVLTSAPVVSVAPTGTCSGLTITYSKNGSSSTVQALTNSSGLWSRSLDTTGWTTSDGAQSIEVKDGTGASLVTVSFELSTLTPCTVSAVTTNPTAGHRKQNPSPNVLDEGAVIVTATAASCSGLVLVVVDPAAAGTNVNLAMTQASATSWTASIPSSQTWSDATKTLQVFSGTGTTPTGSPLGSTTFVVSPKDCAAVTMTLSQSSIGHKKNSQTLASDVTVTVTTEGVCSGLRLRFTPDTTVRTPSMNESATGSGTWTYVLQSNGNTAYNWTSGDHTIDALLGATATTSAKTVTLTVTP